MARFTENRRSGYQGVYLGPAGTVADFNESSLTYPGQLGACIEDGEVSYQLVQLASGATTVAADATLYWNTADHTDFVVHHADQTHGTAGVSVGAITNGNYGFSKFGRYDSARIADPT